MSSFGGSKDRGMHVVEVDVGTVMEGVDRRESTVSFQAQDISYQRVDGHVDVSNCDEKRMQKDRVGCYAPLLCYLMCNLASSAINDVCSSAWAKGYELLTRVGWGQSTKSRMKNMMRCDWCMQAFSFQIQFEDRPVYALASSCSD